MPELFRILASDIPNILEDKDLKYYIKTGEKCINGSLSN